MDAYFYWVTNGSHLSVLGYRVWLLGWVCQVVSFTSFNQVVTTIGAKLRAYSPNALNIISTLTTTMLAFDDADGSKTK